MVLGWQIYRAMILCPHKAWQLLREENAGVNAIPDKMTLHDKMAVTAWHYGEMLAAGEVIKPPAKARKLFEDVKGLIEKGTAPTFFKNPHCRECKFWNGCHQQLKEKDCISLLSGITPNIVKGHHKKGVTTILQLSHLFKLRRQRTLPKVAGRYLYELKALAIREKKTYVLKIPDIVRGLADIYLDFEGLPEEDFIYLAGVMIRQPGNQDKAYSFWANGKENEEEVFLQLFELLGQYPDASIFHYGSYETKVLKKWKRIYTGEFEAIEKRMVNLLSFFRTHVYPPTYSNGLKEVAGFLGFNWTVPDANGLKSIEWRKNWEATAGEKWKNNLIQYNLDDCKALGQVHDWFQRLELDGEKDNVQQVSKMKKHSPYRLQNNTEYGEDFQYISKAAYFDYQQSKIYWRDGSRSSPVSVTKKGDGVKHFGRGQPVWQPKRVNEIIQIPPLKKCPHCGHRKLYRAIKQRTFRQTDLKFTPRGIKQWVIEYHASGGTCSKCRMKYNDAVLKRRHLGDNLYAWAVNLYVNYHISFAMISRLLREQFGIWANPTYFNEKLYEWWEKFRDETDSCRQIILDSPVIHIDETTVRLGKEQDRGYVWAFATSHTVYYHLTLSREAGFLQEWLKDYKGVIVSDFFAGYESIQVKRQKCLIHLIRDLNDDLYKTPFDEEYKGMVNGFSQLLRKIVATIDRRGLKKYFLKKHIRDTAKFYKDFVEREQKSELARKYAKRFRKHWPELWTFLEHDGLPWNNNNAEAAIKGFAVHRRGVNGQVTKGGLVPYLSMLSVAQTCRYRGVGFLEWMRGRVGK